MMPTKMIKSAAFALENQLQAGAPMADVVERMARLQPAYAEYWRSVSQQIRLGHSLSEHLREIWPEQLINAVRAGEEAGKLPDVFRRIKEALNTQLHIQKKMWGIAMPIAYVIGAIGVGIFFLTVVIPANAEVLGGGEKGIVLQVSGWITTLLSQYWAVIVAFVVGSAFLGANWIREPENRAVVVDKLVALPVVGDALTLINYSLWASYMAITASAGIPTSRGLEMTSTVLPASLRESIALMAAEIDLRGLADSADPLRQRDGDPRMDLPHYITSAFIVADTSGELDVALSHVAPSMLEEGVEKLDIAIQLANYGVLILAAILIAGPIIAHYVQLGTSIQNLMGG